jgi:hypothetical protein
MQIKLKNERHSGSGGPMKQIQDGQRIRVDGNQGSV